MPDFPLVDTHVHFWNPTTLRYPWLDGNQKLNRPFHPADFRAACGPVKVGKIVFVECGSVSGGVAESSWVTGLTAEEPRIAGIVANAEVERGEAVAEDLEQLALNPLVRGVRRLLQGENEPGYCLRPDFLAGVRLLPRFGFTFDICIRHTQMDDVIEMVRQCPDVSFVLDHIGKPNIRLGLWEPWRSRVGELASLPNVTCKISGMVTEADHANWTADELKPYVESVIESFGFDRVLFGGDWPVATLAAPYPRWVETLDTLVSECSDPEKVALYVRNAERVYRV